MASRCYIYGKKERRTVPRPEPEDPDIDILDRDEALQPDLTNAQRNRKASGEACAARDRENTYNGRKCKLSHLTGHIPQELWDAFLVTVLARVEAFSERTAIRSVLMGFLVRDLFTLHVADPLDLHGQPVYTDIPVSQAAIPDLRPRGAGQRRGRVVLVDEHRTTRVSSAVNGQQPCEEHMDHEQLTRRAGWKPPAGQVEQRLVRPAWSQQCGQPVRGLMWCPVVAPRKPPQAPRSSQEATPAAASEPGPSNPPPAKRTKRTKAEQADEPTQPPKVAKAKPAPQPGRWLDRDCNAALNMQRIGESRWRPLELYWWPDQTTLSKEFLGPVDAVRVQGTPVTHFMYAYDLTLVSTSSHGLQRLVCQLQIGNTLQSMWASQSGVSHIIIDQTTLPAKGKEYPGLGYKRLRDKPPKAQEQQPAVAQ
ncbi:hypothetical protein QJQ45_006966 [Haematococcus lacustris]|nr:hypothetical protein QJQ45_006966 [Haematococcus lacustris]